MAFDIQTLNDGNVLLVRTEEVMTVEDMRELGASVHTHFQHVRGDVHIIADMLNTREHPASVAELRQSLDWTEQPNLGWVIYLSRNSELNSLVDRVMSLCDRTYLVLDNLEAAKAIVMGSAIMSVD